MKYYELDNDMVFFELKRLNKKRYQSNQIIKLDLNHYKGTKYHSIYDNQISLNLKKNVFYKLKTMFLKL